VRISSPNSSDGRAAAGGTVLEIDAAERKQRERESVAAMQEWFADPHPSEPKSDFSMKNLQLPSLD